MLNERYHDFSPNYRPVARPDTVCDIEEQKAGVENKTPHERTLHKPMFANMASESLGENV
jgi:hypothetical protein